MSIIELHHIQGLCAEEHRAIRIILDCIDRLELSLTGLTVLTEVGTNYYLYTPIIAALAGAKRVYAWTADTPYGLGSKTIKKCKELTRNYHSINNYGTTYDITSVDSDEDDGDGLDGDDVNYMNVVHSNNDKTNIKIKETVNNSTTTPTATKAHNVTKSTRTHKTTVSSKLSQSNRVVKQTRVITDYDQSEILYEPTIELIEELI